jgi:hypothetical protein
MITRKKPVKRIIIPRPPKPPKPVVYKVVTAARLKTLLDNLDGLKEWIKYNGPISGLNSVDVRILKTLVIREYLEKCDQD